MNLLCETREILRKHGHDFSDILWVGTSTYIILTEDFIDLANVDYDNGFGCTNVNENLVVVGDGWWLERAEYDGSEWWEYKTPPKKPDLINHDASVLW